MNGETPEDAGKPTRLKELLFRNEMSDQQPERLGRVIPESVLDEAFDNRFLLQEALTIGDETFFEVDTSGESADAANAEMKEEW